MPPRFSIFRHIEPHAIRSMADSHPRLRHLADVLVEKHGLSRERARHFVERLVTVVINDFGETYTGEMSARLDRIVNLREKVTGIYESTINGKGLPDGVTPSSVEGMFRELQREMNELHSPTRAAEEGRLPKHDDIVSQMVSSQSSSHAVPVRKSAFGEQLSAVQHMEPNLRETLTSVAEHHYDTVREMISAETQEGLTRYSRKLRDELIQSGMNEEQIGRTVRELAQLNEAQRQANHTARITDARLREASSTGQLRDSRLQNATTGSDRLRRWAVEAPTTLESMWDMYNRKSRNYPFDTYVGYLERHIRGNFGEFEAAFRLGNDFAVLKAPDGHVTVRGTDLVVVDRRTGELLLIDNKALNAEELQAVSALTRNLPHNVLSDLREFQTFSSRSDTPIEVAAAVQRFEQANQAVQTYTSGMSRSQLSSELVQQHIAGILQAHNVRRVITNAGGQVRSLSPALQRIGIELKDLN
jgi:polyhydroxyalkanoate synthesis regulator phasin